MKVDFTIRTMEGELYGLEAKDPKTGRGCGGSAESFNFLKELQ